MALITDLPILTDDHADIDSPRQVNMESGGERTVYLETYGCQMNVSDSEIVASVLRENGFGLTRDPDTADVVLLNTCAIRENAEQKVRRRLDDFRAQIRKQGRTLQLGVLGCMAERLRHKLLEQEKLVDIVVGPDAYRDLPRLLNVSNESGHAADKVHLSRVVSYYCFASDRLTLHSLCCVVHL